MQGKDRKHELLRSKHTFLFCVPEEEEEKKQGWGFPRQQKLSRSRFLLPFVPSEETSRKREKTGRTHVSASVRVSQWVDCLLFLALGSGCLCVCVCALRAAGHFAPVSPAPFRYVLVGQRLHNSSSGCRVTFGSPDLSAPRSPSSGETLLAPQFLLLLFNPPKKSGF